MLAEKISPQWQKIIDRLKKQGTEKELTAIQRQIQFNCAEHNFLECETPDPLGANYHSVAENTERLVHQYKNRCLFILTGKCFAHCRYCFRRESDALQLQFASEVEIDVLCNYIAEHSEIQEVLLTGGDPLTASNAKLEDVLQKLRKTNPNLIIRLATRAPIFAPERITNEFIAMVKNYAPVWVIPHINHYAEISKEFSPESRQALINLRDAGIPMQSQSVLLKNVNDSVEPLAKLFNDLVVLGIKPGYLFQGDLAPGTSHFRLGINAAIELYNQLKPELSGLSLPTFAVDLPNGGGKVNLANITEKQYKTLQLLYGE